MKTICFLLTIFAATSAFAQTETNPVATPEATATPAPEPKKVDVTTGATKLKIGGVVWANYGYDLTEGKESKNAFDVGRAYVNIEPSWGDRFSARITPDLVREVGPAVSGTSGTLTPGNTVGNLSLRLKYAYLTYTPTKDSSLRIGLQQTAFVELEENVWGYRFVAPIAADQFYGMSSSDFGASAGYKALGGRLEVVGGAYNGETYQKPETNKYKEWQTRATFQVLPAKAGGLKVTGYYGIANKARNVDKVRGIALVSYQHEMFTAAAEYIYAHDGGGSAGPRKQGGGPSAFASVKLPFLPEYGLNAMARVDLVDPDADADDDGQTRMIVGLGSVHGEKVRFLLDLQRIDFEDDREDQQVLFAHWEAKF